MPKRRLTPWLCGCVALFCLLTCAVVRANDGGITFGGSPRLLAGQTTVSMQSEVVRMTVGAETVTVDCQFVFRNTGPACSVRMGFPDRQRGDAQKFTSFTSYVDGKLVPTQYVLGANHSEEDNDDWHAKTVTFPRHGIRRVRDVYTVPVGSQIIDQGVLNQAFYVLHTGASWHGPIGRTDVFVTFNRSKTASSLTAKPLSSIKNDAYRHDWRSERPNTVIYRGPSKPTVQGKTFHFVRTNWRPAYKDDILLYFGFQDIKPVQ